MPGVVEEQLLAHFGEEAEQKADVIPRIAVTINEEHPFGLFVSYPRFFEGDREEDRLKWYATTTAKDILLSAKVCMQGAMARAHRQGGLHSFRVFPIMSCNVLCDVTP